MCCQIPQNTLGVTTASCVGQHSPSLFCKTISLQQLHKHSAAPFINRYVSAVPLRKLTLYRENLYSVIACRKRKNEEEQQSNFDLISFCAAGIGTSAHFGDGVLTSFLEIGNYGRQDKRRQSAGLTLIQKMERWKQPIREKRQRDLRCSLASAVLYLCVCCIYQQIQSKKKKKSVQVVNTELLRWALCYFHSPP